MTHRQLVSRSRPLWLLLAFCLLAPIAIAASSDDPRILEAERLFAEGQRRDAIEYLAEQRTSAPDDAGLALAEVKMLMTVGRLAEARKLIADFARPDRELRVEQTRIETRLEQYFTNYNLAHIYIQKRIEAEDYDTAIMVADTALERFPDKARDLYTLKGEALYKDNQLEEAEIILREALQIDPLNEVAKGYVEEIRSTIDAQTSEELAEWVLIAKDKVGDFIVTFLALFSAFVTNSLMAPVMLRIKLNRARRSFDNGSYDEFTDVIERLLDQEEFTALRNNLRYVLRQKGYDEVHQIFNKYVVTADRLPTLLRVLERENERMLEAA